MPRSPHRLERRALLLGLAAVAGCGFRPAYGPGGAAEGLRGRVRVAEPENRLGFLFAERLEERLGPPEAPSLELVYGIDVEEDALAITPVQEITRFNLIGRIDYSLTDLASGDTVRSGSVESFTAYDATGSTISTVSAERDARRRLMRILADRIVTRLIAEGASR